MLEPPSVPRWFGTIILPFSRYRTAEAGLAGQLSIVSKLFRPLINYVFCLYSDEFRVAPILHEFRLFEDVPVLPNGLSDLLPPSYGFAHEVP